MNFFITFVAAPTVVWGPPSTVVACNPLYGLLHVDDINKSEGEKIPAHKYRPKTAECEYLSVTVHVDEAYASDSGLFLLNCRKEVVVPTNALNKFLRTFYVKHNGRVQLYTQLDIEALLKDFTAYGYPANWTYLEAQELMPNAPRRYHKVDKQSGFGQRYTHKVPKK